MKAPVPRRRAAVKTRGGWFPRIAVAVVVVLWIIPALGFVLVPWTTLTFSVMWPIGSDKVSGWEWIAVGIALLVDYVFWALSRSAFK